MVEPVTPAGARACELRRKAAALALLVALGLGLAPAAHATQAAQPAGAHEAEPAAHGGTAGLFWPLANFLVLAGGLWYFLRQPIRAHLGERHAAIRKDLEEAATLRAAAAQQLAEIEGKLQALPDEIAALRRRGAEEIAAEEQRIAAAAAAERDRLLAEMRREIDRQVRLARKQLLEHAADLVVRLAGERLKKDITPADHARLVEQYLTQLRAARGGGAAARAARRPSAAPN